MADWTAKDPGALYAAADDKFGYYHQNVVAVEELVELSQVVCKLLRSGLHLEPPGCLPHLAEELADVRIVLEQLEHRYDLAEQVRAWRCTKLARLARRVRTGNDSAD